MATRFLSDEQRRRYGRYAGEPSEEQLARHFHLDATDREIIALLRGAHNRIGFAAQLGTVRFLGVFLDDLGQVPRGVIADIAHQLSEQGDVDLVSYGNGRQRWRHMAMICECYGFRTFAEAGAARFRLARWLYTLAWTGDDRPSLLFDRATSTERRPGWRPTRSCCLASQRLNASSRASAIVPNSASGGLWPAA